ncbi:uncharacterized protein G2W53_012076 [Senna tora]|uniref:Uncharacterized protein n=1 Tax=Senna tora TaxID=362788 RepID=A0A834WQF5_9FABA|nr:uncharacterized protein G2W53_012076 [Senna tora]
MTKQLTVPWTSPGPGSEVQQPNGGFG